MRPGLDLGQFPSRMDGRVREQTLPVLLRERLQRARVVAACPEELLNQRLFQLTLRVLEGLPVERFGGHGSSHGYNPDGYVSATSPASHATLRSSGSTARVSSKCS